MIIEHEKLKTTCNSCSQQIILTFNATQCPLCGTKFDPTEVKTLFYNYESQLLNSKMYQHGQKLKSVGNSIQNTGQVIHNIGCLIFMIPISLFCLYILFSVFFK